MKDVKGSKNVFKDLGFDAEETGNLRARAMLMTELEKYIKREEITQAVAARRFGVTQPRVSDLVNGKIGLFTVDMLMTMLISAGMSVDIHVHRKKAA